MLRGKGGQDIFFSPKDRYRLYLLLQEGTEMFDYRVHGFRLMINHLHLAMQVADKPLARCMQNLSFRYTRWVNDRQGRTGHLFQGRYKGCDLDLMYGSSCHGETVLVDFLPELFPSTLR